MYEVPASLEQQLSALLNPKVETPYEVPASLEQQLMQLLNPQQQEIPYTVPSELQQQADSMGQGVVVPQEQPYVAPQELQQQAAQLGGRTPASGASGGWGQEEALIEGMPHVDMKTKKVVPYTQNISMEQAAPARQAPTQPMGNPEPTLLAQLEGAYNNQKRMEQEQQAKMQNMAKQLGANKATPNFQGLYNYVNAQTGSNFQSVKDKTSDNNKELMQKLIAATGASKGKESAADINFLKQKLGLEKEKNKADALLEKERLDREARARLAKLKMKATKASGPGLKKVNQDMASEWVKFNTKEAAEAQTEVASLGEAVRLMESGEVETGGTMNGILGAMPGSAITVPEIDKVRQRIYAVIYTTLKKTLGAQFAKIEGERLLANTFNAAAPTAENARRARELMEKLVSVYRAKKSALESFQKGGFNVDATADNISAIEAGDKTGILSALGVDANKYSFNDDGTAALTSKVSTKQSGTKKGSSYSDMSLAELKKLAGE